MHLHKITIRNIEETDNAAIAAIIRSALLEFGAAHPGTVYYEEATDRLHSVFNAVNNAAYFIAACNGEVLGGGGIYPTEGLPAATCELVKMYLKPEARGIGLGRKMIEQCTAVALAAGYTSIYLESMPELSLAMKTYERLGFDYLSAPMGNSGHHGCQVWMKKEIR